MSLFDISQRLFSQKTKATVLLKLGVGELARRACAGQASVLTFHGLRDAAPDPAVLDSSLYLSVTRFEAVCKYLKEHANVLPLQEIASRLREGQPLPPNTVAITFDDGCLSNYTLAYPVLKKWGLPATIFLTTGYLDGTESLWFQRVDWALANTQASTFRGHSLQSAEDRISVLNSTLQHLKTLSDPELRQQLIEIEKELGVSFPTPNDLPPQMRPMSWDQVREMAASGLIELGGHTHTHPILARCSLAQQEREITECRDRIANQVGQPPVSFAYTNGGTTDFTADTQRLLKEAGFTLACTMMHGRWLPQSDGLSIPRYGSPETAAEAGATVTGAFELVHQWRKAALKKGGNA